MNVTRKKREGWFTDRALTGPAAGRRSAPVVWPGGLPKILLGVPQVRLFFKEGKSFPWESLLGGQYVKVKVSQMVSNGLNVEQATHSTTTSSKHGASAQRPNSSNRRPSIGDVLLPPFRALLKLHTSASTPARLDEHETHQPLAVPGDQAEPQARKQ
jgi:hypothetical protein